MCVVYSTFARCVVVERYALLMHASLELVQLFRPMLYYTSHTHKFMLQHARTLWGAGRG